MKTNSDMLFKLLNKREVIDDISQIWLILSALADALEEEGDLLHLTVRWMVKKRRRPLIRTTSDCFVWYRLIQEKHRWDPRSDIPKKVFQWLDSRAIHGFVEYSSFKRAVEGLSHALSKEGDI